MHFRVEASGPALSDTAVGAICGVSTKISGIPCKAKNKLLKLTEQVKTATALVKMLQVKAAMTEDSTTQTACNAIAIAATQEAQSSLLNLNGAIGSAINAAAVAQEVRGRIDEYISLLRDAQGTGNNGGYCLASGGGNHPQQAAIGQSCTITDRKFNLESADITNDELDATGIKGATPVPDGAGKSNGAASCVLHQHAGASDAARFHQKQKTYKVLSGLVKITNAAGSTTIAIADLGTIANNGVAENGKPLAYLYTAIKDLKDAPATPPSETVE
uniref:Variant surface glycoprotein 1125.2967 n=1 Tax=Trypanosoma brucei TaxID=5691 RepID=A0A1J0R9G2_9TRYP|nr:variant surface glycoprotein 1125.2967 [Trypanosoma brucei]